MISTAASLLISLTMMQQGALVHPEAPSMKPPVTEKKVAIPTPPPKPASPVVGNDPRTGKPVAKQGLGPTDYAYTMPEGVATKEVVYYSDGVACYGKIFYPKGFDTSKKTAAVVLGQGWAGSHVSIEKYAAAFAKHGLVAMAIDYRGWGNSEGKARVISPVNLGGGMEKDEAVEVSYARDITIQYTMLAETLGEHANLGGCLVHHVGVLLRHAVEPVH